MCEKVVLKFDEMWRRKDVEFSKSLQRGMADVEMLGASFTWGVETRDARPSFTWGDDALNARELDEVKPEEK